MNKKNLIVSVGIVASFMLAGCMSTGNATLKEHTQDTISEELREGMTQAEVRQSLGDPFNVSYTDGGSEIWTYEFAEGQMTAESFIPIVGLFTSGVEGQKKQLVILFDEQQLVRRFTLSESDFESRSGIIRQ